MAKDRQLHIANDVAQPIYVIVAPSMNYAIVDMFVSGTVAGQSAARKDMGSISSTGVMRNLSDIQKLVNILELMKLAGKARTDTAAQQQAASYRQSLGNYLKQHATLIRPGNVAQVLKADLGSLKGYLSTSGWTALFNSDSVSLFLATEDLERFAFVTTAPDHSWIFRYGGVVRSKYGSLWQPDSDAGFVYASKGDRLPSGSWLEPGESLTSANGYYVFVYQHDGNAVVYDVRNVAKHEAKWASGTANKPAWRLELMNIGKIVIWSAPGQHAWVDSRSVTDKETLFSHSTLIMGDDGILRVIGDSGEEGWTSVWKF
jgi:hypothetical protein